MHVSFAFEGALSRAASRRVFDSGEELEHPHHRPLCAAVRVHASEAASGRRAERRGGAGRLQRSLSPRRWHCDGERHDLHEANCQGRQGEIKRQRVHVYINTRTPVPYSPYNEVNHSLPRITRCCRMPLLYQKGYSTLPLTAYCPIDAKTSRFGGAAETRPLKFNPLNPTLS